MLARARTLGQALAFAKVPWPATPAFSRFISASPSLHSEDAVSKKAGSASSAIVDPQKDNSLQEVLAIPVHKPLIPSAPLRHLAPQPAGLCT